MDLENELMKCRLCLEKGSEVFDLFLEEDQMDDEREHIKTELFEKVEFCCGVRIRKSAEMPSKICMKCFDMVKMWYNFRQMCLNSQVYLESLCSDRKIPEEFEDDESVYLSYLVQELQTIRGDDTQFNFSDSDLYSETGDLGTNENSEISDNEIEDFVQNLNNDDDEEEMINEEECNEPSIQVKKGKTSKTKIEKKPTKASILPAKYRKKIMRPPSPTSYMCSICGNVYTKKANFNYHMTLHSNIKPHECEICGKCFRQVSELKNHIRRHTGEKPYRCTFCDRRFVDKSEQLRHERVHTNTRPYTCKVCGKSFAYSTILKNHSKLHSGEKNFSCQVCNKSFCLPHQLKAHLLTMTHKQKQSEYVSAGYDVVYE